MKKVRFRWSLILVLFFGLAINVHTQHIAKSKKFSKELEKQLSCHSKPVAGKFLIELRRQAFTSGAYSVVDTISYFRLRKPLGVWNFKPLAVFGFQAGYPKFFERSPGTLPPEMIGIVVAETIESVNTKLEKLGVKGLNVEQAEFNLRGNSNTSKKLTEISCWEKFEVPK